MNTVKKKARNGLNYNPSSIDFDIIVDSSRSRNLKSAGGC